MMLGYLSAGRCRNAMLIAAAFLGLGQTAPAAATVRTTLSFLSFLSPTDLRQGEVRALGTGVDPDGISVPRGVFACCFAVPATPAGGTPSTLRRTFSNLDTVNQIYFFGVSTVDAQNHLVLALNTSFSTTLVGREFGTVFSGFSESQLIADLFAASDVSLTNEQRAAAADRRIQFGNRLFGLNAGFGVNDDFTLTSFSLGVPAGTGFSTLTPAAPVPEPATWAMMVLGFAIMGMAVRQQRRRHIGVAAAC